MLVACNVKIKGGRKAAEEELRKLFIFKYEKPYLICSIYFIWNSDFEPEFRQIEEICQKYRCRMSGRILCYDKNGQCVRF